MRNMSFALTTEAIRNRSKTVTRRLRWLTLKPGTLLQPVVKAQGIPKGGKVEKVGGPIRVLNVRREPLDIIGTRYLYDPVLEGFPLLTNGQFVEMFCLLNNCEPFDTVTRIEFEYVGA